MTRQTAEQWKEAVNAATRAARGVTVGGHKPSENAEGMNRFMREALAETRGVDHPAFDRHKSGE